MSLPLLFLCFLQFFVPARAEDPEPASGAPEVAEKVEGEAEEANGEGEAEVVYEVPEKVTVGVHLNDIQSIDLKTHSYQMDFYIWFRWKNPDLDPATSMEIANPFEQWGLMVTPLYEEPETLDDGSMYQVLRVQGSFSKKLPLYNYPFDRQELAVVFEDGVNDKSTVVYVPEATASMNPNIQLPGYRIESAAFNVMDWHYATGFGDPRTEANTQYSRATLSVPITRPPLAYSTKLFLPVGCVIVCAALMFLLGPALVDSRVDVGITSLLTIVALQMTYNDNLPDVGYLMLMDKIYLCAYLFVIAGLGMVVHTTRLHEAGKEAEAKALHGRSLGLLLLVWSAGMLVLIVGAVRAG